MLQRQRLEVRQDRRRNPAVMMQLAQKCICGIYNCQHRPVQNEPPSHAAEVKDERNACLPTTLHLRLQTTGSGNLHFNDRSVNEVQRSGDELQVCSQPRRSYY